MDPRRLKRIAIDFPHGAFANALHATQPLELPELEYLELSAHSLSCCTQPHHVYLINLFERTPKLHTLRLSLQDLVATPFTLQRDGIVNLHLVNYREYPSLPVDFPNVITATLRRCQLVFYETIELPFHKLILHDTDMNPSLFGTSFSSRHILKMPRLSSLELICSEPSDPLVYTVSLESIPDLAHSPLTELILTTATIKCTEALLLFRTVLQLERLSIVERMDTHLITPEFIQELGRPGPEILRNLEHLQLVWSGHVDEGAVMDMLEGRALESAVIGIRKGGELRADALSRVDALRKHGMQTSVW